jgi:hypothetical protein
MATTTDSHSARSEKSVKKVHDDEEEEEEEGDIKQLWHLFC